MIYTVTDFLDRNTDTFFHDLKRLLYVVFFFYFVYYGMMVYFLNTIFWQGSNARSPGCPRCGLTARARCLKFIATRRQRVLFLNSRWLPWSIRYSPKTPSTFAVSNRIITRLRTSGTTLYVSTRCDDDITFLRCNVLRACLNRYCGTSFRYAIWAWWRTCVYAARGTVTAKSMPCL